MGKCKGERGVSIYRVLGRWCRGPGRASAARCTGGRCQVHAQERAGRLGIGFRGKDTWRKPVVSKHLSVMFFQRYHTCMQSNNQLSYF